MAQGPSWLHLAMIVRYGADKYGLEIVEVVGSEGSELLFTGDGLLINSDILNGLSIKDAKRKVISHRKS